MIWSGGGQYTETCVKVEIIGERSYTLPLLNEPRFGHSLATTNQRDLLIVGGTKAQLGYQLAENEGKDVLILKGGKWLHHSELGGARIGSVVVTMPDGIYVFGGMHNAETSEFLPNGQNIWQEGPSLPKKGIWAGSGVPISQHELVLVGGYSTEKRVMKFNILTQEWTFWDNLATGRFNHSCAFYKDSIIVTGGSFGLSGHTTDIIEVSNGTNRKGAKLNYARCGHAMGVVKWLGTTRLMVMKGFMKNSKVNTNEAWNEATEKWEALEDLIEIVNL